MNSAPHTHEAQPGLTPSDIIYTQKVQTISETPLFPLNVTEIARIAKMLLISSFPTSISQLSSVVIAMTSLGYIGKYGNGGELAGASLGHTWVFLFYLGVLLSLNAGFQITASQLYGANKRHELAQTFQKTLFIFAILTVPLILCLFIVNSLLISFGTDQAVKEYSEMFLLCSIPSLLSLCFTDCIKSYLLSQNYFYVQGVIKSLAILLHFFWCHLFVVVLGMPALVGATLAKGVTDVSIIIAFISYLRFSNVTNEMPLKWDKSCLVGLKEYSKQIFVIGANIYVQWAVEGIFGFLISLLGDPAVIGANGLGSMFTVVIFTFPLGNSITMQTYLGNAVGAGWRYRAKKIVFAGFSLNLILTVISMLIMFIGNDYISSLMTNDEVTKNILKNIIYLYGAAYIADTYAEHMSNVLRTTGQAKIVNMVAMISCLGIGIPLEWLLGFGFEYGYIGMWTAVVIQTYMMFVWVLRMFLKLNWKVEIEKVKRKINETYKAQGLDKYENMEEEDF